MPDTTDSLPMIDPRHAPLASMDVLQWALGRNADEVLTMIEAAPNHDRKLRWAWNIATPGAERREIRVLSASVLEFIGAHPEMVAFKVNGWDGFKARRAKDRDVWERILPPGHSKPYLTTPQVQRCLGCSEELVLDLVRAEQLRTFRATEFGRGRYGAALINNESLRCFLFESGRRIA